MKPEFQIPFDAAVVKLKKALGDPEVYKRSLTFMNEERTDACIVCGSEEPCKHDDCSDTVCDICGHITDDMTRHRLIIHGEPPEPDVDDPPIGFSTIKTATTSLNRAARPDLLDQVDLAIAANGGHQWNQKNCTCDASVNMAPCQYCAIYWALNKMRSQLAQQQRLTYDEMRELLHRMYIARNISLNDQDMQECLKTLDGWFRSEEGMN